MRVALAFKKISLILLFSSILTITFSLDYGYSITNSNDLSGVGVKEKLGETIPTDLEFTDSDGSTVRLGEFFKGKKPVVLSLVYYRCPRLCTFVLEGIADAVNNLKELSLGDDYKVVSVSINPAETEVDARSKSEGVFKKLNGVDSPGKNWHFLTGDEHSIATLAESVGFRYIKDGDQFAHPASIAVLTPQGEISRYLYGVQYPPLDFRIALLEASKGEIGKSRIINRVLLYCYRFDPVGKKYALYALNILKGGGIITLLSITVLIAYLVMSEKRRSKGGGNRQQ